MLKFKFGEFAISGLVCSGNKVDKLVPVASIPLKCNSILNANDLLNG
jgi:hypothetical protein